MMTASVALAALSLAAVPPLSLVERLSDSLRCDVQFRGASARPVALSCPGMSECPSPPALVRLEAETSAQCGDRIVGRGRPVSSPEAVASPHLGTCPSLSALGAPGCVLEPETMPIAGGECPMMVSHLARSLPDRAADGILAGMVFDGLSDGTFSPRLPKWRPFLLNMLAGRVPTKDFDRTFELLLGTFPGSDSTARIAALRAWTAHLPVAKDAADVYRALTRHYIAAGEYDLAVGAADVMVEHHGGYLPNALYLKGHAHAFAGRFDDARQCLAEAVALGPVGAAEARILYLRAWMLLQEGDVKAAAAILQDIVLRHPSTKYARQARSILEGL